MSKFFKAVNHDSLPFLTLDQLVSPYQVASVLPFFDDLKVIIVDRDPRDIFLLNEFVWKRAAYICDTSCVITFIEWYRSIREHWRIQDAESSSILRLNFEDLVYNYQESIESIEQFLGISPSDHLDKFKFFDPSHSLKNTRLWHQPEYSCVSDKISLISAMLPEYLHD